MGKVDSGVSKESFGIIFAQLLYNKQAIKMEMEEIKGQRLREQGIYISVCILVCSAATEVERKWEEAMEDEKRLIYGRHNYWL